VTRFSFKHIALQAGESMADLTKLTPISQEILTKFGATVGTTDSEQVWQQRVYIPSKLVRIILIWSFFRNSMF
jgi:hypothetical protein